MGLLKNFHKTSSQPLFKLFSLFFLLSIAIFLYYNQHTRLALFGPHLLQLQHISTDARGDDSVASNATRLSSPPPSFDDDDDDAAHEQIVGGLSLSIDQERPPSSEQGSVDDQERRSALPDCDIFDGRWVADDDDGGSSPSYEEGSCPYVDDAFNCYRNGRPDSNYTRLRWKPKNCDIPRLDGKKLLEMLRGKRLALVGDSLNRNMWESLVCILRDSLDDKERMYEVSGRKDFRADNSYAFRFIDYNCSIEYFRSIFLVQESEVVGPNGTRKETLRLDSIDKSSVEYKDADVIVFNTAHWWTHEKTSQGKDYYQEGDHVYSQLSAEEALLKALQTWGQWVDTSIDPNHTRVFFRGYSSSHFGGGKWNKGGNCNGETLPVSNDTQLVKAPKLVKVIETALGEMRTPVMYLNITRLTDYRKDAHPSMYRMPIDKRLQMVVGGYQDCSHWCLPGVPDTWNELLYVMLLRDFY